MQYEAVDESDLDADVAVALWQIREQAGGAELVPVTALPAS